MNSKYILAFDQGTSSSRALLFDANRNIVGMEQEDLSQYYKRPGWVEQNPNEIWETQINTAKRLLARLQIKPSEIAGIGITNQRETAIVWDKLTGEPIYNAIVWQDKRTASYCNLLKAEGLSKYIKRSTGLVIDSYFSATKIRWILLNVEKAQERSEKGELLCGTIDTWLVWKLTKGALHITDYSNASRTLIFDIQNLCWDNTLLDIFSIHSSMLPEVKSSSEIYGHTDKSIFDGVEIPIASIVGDQQAALFGQTCFEPGMAKNTYGTGCFMLKNIGEKPILSNSGLLTTVAWGINGKIEYALEGSVFITGAAVKWLRDGLHLIKNVQDTEDIAASVEDSNGLYVVPAFVGLGAPHWDMYARGAILGITQGVSDKHLVRATLESIAFQTKDILEAMYLDTKIPIVGLNVDGGASKNNFLMQFQADILDVEVVRPENIETTATGSAYLAGLALGMWTKQELAETRKIEQKFAPDMDEEHRSQLYKGWKKAIERTKNWAVE